MVEALTRASKVTQVQRGVGLRIPLLQQIAVPKGLWPKLKGKVDQHLDHLLARVEKGSRKLQKIEKDNPPEKFRLMGWTPFESLVFKEKMSISNSVFNQCKSHSHFNKFVGFVLLK